jgi:predicted metal-binding protein
MGIENIHVPDWTEMKCRFGCSGYGKRHCPPHGLSPAKTREIIKDYRYAMLLEGEPPTGAFQLQVLEAEKEAFKAGFHKAFAYWAGPCAICNSCAGDGVCRNPGKPRPSMEGAGIDVFETVRRAGIELKTLENRDEFVKYFALLLLE